MRRSTPPGTKLTPVRVEVTVLAAASTWLRLGFRLLPALQPTTRVVRAWTDRRHGRSEVPWTGRHLTGQKTRRAPCSTCPSPDGTDAKEPPRWLLHLLSCV